MREFLLVLLCLSSNCVFANNYDEALNNAIKALSQLPEVKEKVKNFERFVISVLPVEKETAGIIGGIGFTLIEGRLDTSMFKNLEMNFLGGKIRPDLEYNFRESSASGFLNCRWELSKLTD